MQASVMDSRLIAEALGEVVKSHDPARDLSNRAEGTFEAITAIAKKGFLGQPHNIDLAEAIIDCCKRYKQSITIGTGSQAREWPTNRYAMECLEALGIKKPEARAAA